MSVRTYWPWEPTATLRSALCRRGRLGGARRVGSHRGRRGDYKNACKNWSFCVKGCRHKGESPNWGALELCSLGMGGVADPNIHPLQLPRQISASKVVCINRRELQNSGALGQRPLAVWAWLTHRNTPHVLCCRICVIIYVKQ